MVKKRDLISQLILIAAIMGLSYYFYSNASENLSKRGITAGFLFLENKTGFDVIMHLVSYSAASTYMRLFIVGILNTILLSALCIFFSTIIGVLVAVARLSPNWLVSRLAACYIETFRNIPLLLQIFFWYYLILHQLPTEHNSLTFFNLIHLNLHGLYLPINGLVIIPELIAMLLGISIYAATYIAENVRSGILSVDSGQTEAARALGLKKKMILRLIILPQASKVIIPPIASQYLNIIKNSSLSAAIGYPDLVAVFAGTALSQTGQEMETILMTMLVYLSISLIISACMNWYNHKILMVGK
jgi:general L-amino acid transport system permease protein